MSKTVRINPLLVFIAVLTGASIGSLIAIRTAIIDLGFDFPCAERDAAAVMVDVRQGGMSGRRAEEFIHPGHGPSRAELFRPGNTIAVAALPPVRAVR